MLGAWDLGTKRTLEQLIEFTGVNPRKKEVGGSESGGLGTGGWVALFIVGGVSISTCRVSPYHVMNPMRLWYERMLPCDHRCRDVLWQIFKSSCLKLSWVPFDPEGDGSGDPMSARAFVPPPEKAGASRSSRALAAGGLAKAVWQPPGEGPVYMWVACGALLLIGMGLVSGATHRKGSDYGSRALDV
jgi:hypothetical protein